jgi:hypothetical protein
MVFDSFRGGRSRRLILDQAVSSSFQSLKMIARLRPGKYAEPGLPVTAHGHGQSCKRTADS